MHLHDAVQIRKCVPTLFVPPAKKDLIGMIGRRFRASVVQQEARES
jgi:hypothetical protein